MRVLLTGASGFLGRHLQSFLVDRGYEPWMVRRRATSESGDFAVSSSERTVTVGLEVPGAVEAALAAVAPRTVVHLAGIAHTRGHTAAQYMSANRDLPVRIYEAAFAAGVASFVFLSSAAVHGRRQSLGPNSAYAPTTIYGQAKMEAEMRLQDRRSSGGPPLATIRPPVIYGPGVRANIATLIRLHARGLPVPVPAQSRGLPTVNVLDVCSAIERAIAAQSHCVIVPRDKKLWTHRTFHRAIAEEVGRTPRLVPVPFGRILSSTRLAPLVVGQTTDHLSSADGIEWVPEFNQRAVLHDTVREVVGRSKHSSSSENGN